METQIIHTLTRDFETYAHSTEDGVFFWLARDLQLLLGYKEWRNFHKVILKAKTACELSNQPIEDHFVEINKMVQIGSGATKEIEDMMLTRYACYLIAQNETAASKRLRLHRHILPYKPVRQRSLSRKSSNMSGYRLVRNSKEQKKNSLK